MRQLTLIGFANGQFRTDDLRDGTNLVFFLLVPSLSLAGTPSGDEKMEPFSVAVTGNEEMVKDSLEAIENREIVLVHGHLEAAFPAALDPPLFGIAVVATTIVRLEGAMGVLSVIRKEMGYAKGKKEKK